MTTITDLEVFDLRFPTSFSGDGSDSVHTDPDYSACYVRLHNDGKDSKFKNIVGCGLTFTIGRGNEIVKAMVDSMRFLVLGKTIQGIQDNMGHWIRCLTNESQLRWIGPEKGVISLATAAIVNAFWDLWAKSEKKPVWKLLVDMSPEQLVSLVDFRYLDDCITEEEALEMLRSQERYKSAREAQILTEGFPAYTTQVGWMGYPDEKIVQLSKEFLEKGFTAFKVKVGTNFQDDYRRLKLIRDTIGPKNKLMVDANQKWGVNQAISWMKQLSTFNLTWIEEPTSPDDILGHKKISQALNPLGIGVATGEMCQNKVMFKQYLMSNALQFCQIDSARVSGLNEVLAVYFMAAKLRIPVCPHAGGVGLCEMVQHLQVFDFIWLSGTTENRMIEYIDHLHEHFMHAPRLGRAKYFPPLDSGYSTEIKEESIREFVYPHGEKWSDYFNTGRYKDPSLLLKKELK